MKVGIIGYGNIGEAMVSGLLKSDVVKPEEILASSRNEKKIRAALDKFHIGITRDNIKVTEFADVLIISVKPIGLANVLEQIKDQISEDTIVVSVVSSVEISEIESIIGEKKIARVMLNTPVMVNEGMSALCMNQKVNFEEVDELVALFKSFGLVELVEEKYMEIITAVSGTSPAYVFMMIEAMADGGVMMGLPRRKAYKLAAQSVRGSATMVLESELHPGALKDMVCSPGGSTIDGVYTLENNNFRGTLMKTIREATKKAERIKQKL